MKFKTLFQRRSASSLAGESDGMSGSTKRKKKEAKLLTTTMKGATTTSTTTSTSTKTSAFYIPSSSVVPEAAAAALPSSCTSTAAHTAAAKMLEPSNGVASSSVDQLNSHNQCHQPQIPDDQTENCVRFNYEKCGGREFPRVSGGVSEVVIMKLPDDSPGSSPLNRDLEEEKAKMEEHYKSMLDKANSRIQELTADVQKMNLEKAKRDKEFVQLQHDFLLCIRGSERFRHEAEVKAANLQAENLRLKKELSDLRNERSESQCSSDDGSKYRSLSPLLTAHGSRVVNGSVASGDKKANNIDPPLSPMSEDSLNHKMEKIMQNDSPSKLREEKLAILRKNCRGSVRNGLLRWCQVQTESYKNIEITNFSTSWTNGLALAALVHSIDPTSFDYSTLSPECPVDNFETALKAAEKLGVKKHLNAIKLMNESDNPPWEPIVAYVTEVYMVAPTPTI